MTLNDWCNRNYNSLLEASRNISYGSELSSELLHYALDELLHKPNVQDILDSGGAEFYVIRIMMNSWRSTTSAFYRIYRANTHIQIETWLQEKDIADEHVNDLIDTSAAVKELKSLYWYDRELFQIFMDEGHSMSSLSRATGIPRTSISLTLNRVRTHLKAKIKPQE